MDKNNESSSRREAQDDIIVLGVASTDTKGPPPMELEGVGQSIGVGITE